MNAGDYSRQAMQYATIQMLESRPHTAITDESMKLVNQPHEDSWLQWQTTEREARMLHTHAQDWALWEDGRNIK